MGGSWMARRLLTVQAQVRAALNDAPAGPLKVISLCAGDGRDLLRVLSDHPRRHEVFARLVELDARNTAAASETARLAKLDQVEVMTGAASLIGQYQDMAPDRGGGRGRTRGDGHRRPAGRTC
ncbi:hypothetical protein ABZ614_35720 [Streptomyces sp. NPDC013178]|uniref:hypothetical protein n=1 Tax=Streptomyces sp. NPDC013178 TaxID=3155118 RepID=UPI00340EECA8